MKPCRIVIALAACVACALAGYVVEWSVPGTYALVGVADPVFDVNSDGVPELFVLDDNGTLVIYSGSTHTPLWSVNTGEYVPIVGVGWGYTHYPFIHVANTDDDAAKELVLLAVNPRTTDSMTIFVFDCQTHELEFSPSLRTQMYGLSVADIDNDGHAEICVATNEGQQVLVYGWASAVQEPSSRNRPALGLVVRPVPARSGVLLTLPMSPFPRDVTIADATGRTIRRYKQIPGGARELVWDCSDDTGTRVPAGTYLYRCGSQIGKLEVVE